MEKRDLNQLESAIVYLVGKLPGTLTRTKLVKLLYLADLAAAERGGDQKTVTGARYRSYYYGPYSEEIGKAVKDLSGFEILEYEQFSPSGYRYFLYYPGDLPRFADLNLTADDQAILDDVASRYGQRPLPDILAEVYETRQYKDAAFGETIALTA